MENTLDIFEEGTRQLGGRGRGTGSMIGGRSTPTSMTSSSAQGGIHNNNNKQYLFALFTMIGLLLVFLIYLVRYTYTVYKASLLAERICEAAKNEQNKRQRIVELFATIQCLDSIGNNKRVPVWNNQQGECEVGMPSPLCSNETKEDSTIISPKRNISLMAVNDNDDESGCEGVNYNPKQEEVASPILTDNLSRLGKKSVVLDCCAICIENYQHGQVVVWSPNQACRHAYHRDCMVTYILERDQAGDRKILCPTCKNSFINLPGTGQTSGFINTASSVQKKNANEIDLEQQGSSDRTGD